MLQCGSTRELDLAAILKHKLEKYNLLYNLSACLKGDRRNRWMLTTVLRMSADCRPLGPKEFFDVIFLRIYYTVRAVGSNVPDIKQLGDWGAPCVHPMDEKWKGRKRLIFIMSLERKSTTPDAYDYHNPFSGVCGNAFNDTCVSRCRWVLFF